MASETRKLTAQEQQERKEYIESMSTPGHISVVLQRAVTGEGGDWNVFTSYAAIAENLGRIVSNNALTYSDACELMEARNKLSDLDEVDRSSLDDEISFGYLLGVSRLVEAIVDVKSR